MSTGTAVVLPGSRQRCAACGIVFVWLADARTGLCAAVDLVPRMGGPIDADVPAGTFTRRLMHPAVTAHTFHAMTCAGHQLSPRMAAEIRANFKPPHGNI
jgi:hypothetical protein